MADIPLRTYVQQLDHMIERKNVDEAIAHSRHILSFYPKHLDTYRMLGKALLEKGRHGDAADVFQRVLSVLPDDFISHVGMAIVREDEANLDAALWHMERAFEAMPSNGAIQQELCRLYGRRDGVVPPKARLTRGALGRMYSQGGLYLQAEAELKAALSVDAERVDLQTSLAQVYWYTDQHAPAAQLCGTIVQQLPYSQVGNRILREIFRSRGRDADAALYRQRLEALDPYEAVAPPAGEGASLSTTDQVAPDQVMVTRLEYVAGMEGSGGPDWITSIGARFEEPLARAGDNTPDWLNATAEPQTAFDSADAPGRSGVPDWLAAASPANERAGVAPGEALPAWLNELSEAGAASAPAPVADSDLPDWLKGATGPLADDEVPAWMQSVSNAAATQPLESGSIDETMPGWLAAAQSQAAQPEAFAGSDPLATIVPPAPAGDVTPDAAPAADSDLPDWLKAAPPAPNLGDDLPDWLKASTGSLPDLPAWTSHPAEASAAPPTAPDAPAEPAPWLAGMETVEASAPAIPPDDDLPDWMKPETPDALTTLPPLATETLAETPAGPLDEDAVPDWMAAMTPAQATDDLPPWMQTAAPDVAAPVAAEPDNFDLDLPAGEVPDWLNAVAPAAAMADTSAPEPADALATDDLPDWLSALAPALPSDEAPPWLQPPSSETPPPASAEASAAPATAGDVPDWLEAATASPMDEALPWMQTTPSVAPELVPLTPEDTPAEAVAEPAASDDDLPDWLAAAAATSPSDEVPAWLQSTPAEDETALAASAAVEPEAPAVEPIAAPMDEAPAWLAAAPDTHETVAAAEPLNLEEGEALPAEGDDLPEWLRAVSAASPADEVPAWLQPSSTLEAEPLTSTPSVPATPFDPIAAASAAEDALLASSQAEANEAAAPLAPADMPDWLRNLVEDTDDNRTAQWEAAADAEFGAVEPDDLIEEESEEPEQPLPEGVPAWMQALADSAPAPDIETVSEAPPVTPAQPVVELPDFLQLASPEAIARAAVPFEMDDEPADEMAAPEAADEAEAIQPAELPDWLMALAPDAAANATAPAFDSDVMATAAAGLDLDAAPDWMKTAQPHAPGESPEPLNLDAISGLPPADEAPGAVDLNLDDAPDWLQAAAALPATEMPSAEASSEAEVPAWLQEPSADLPPWAQTQAPGPTDTVINFLRGKDLPDELRQLREQAAASEAAVPAAEPPAEVPVESLPIDTLAEAPSGEAAASAPETGAVADEAQPVLAEPDFDNMTPDEAMRWLESLALRQGAPAEELFMSQVAPEAAEAEVPALPIEPVAVMEPVADLPAAELASPMEPAAVLAAELPADEPASGLSDWLAEVEAGYPIDPLADTAPRKAEPPAVAEMPTPTPLAAVEAEPVLAEAAESPAITAAELAAETEVPDIASMNAEQAMAWLEKLAAQQGASAEELLSAPEDRLDEMPAWITAEQAAAATEPALEPGQVPDWLAELKDAEEAVVPLEPAVLPDWLKPPTEAVAAEPEASLPALVADEPPAQPAVEPDFATMDADAALAWLEGLAAQQGVSDDELMTAPEARTAVAPDWVLAEQAAAEQAPAAEALVPEPVELTPAMMEAAPVEPEVPAPPVAEAPSPPEEPVAPAEPARETASLQPDVSKLARLSDRLAATRRAKEAEIEARFAQQRAEQEEARRLVWESMQAKKAAVEEAAEAMEPSAPPEPATAAPVPPAEPPPVPTRQPEPAVRARTGPLTPPPARGVTVPLPPLPVPDDSAWTPARPPARAPSRYAGQPSEKVLEEARASLQQHDEAAAADALDHLVAEGELVEDVIGDLEGGAAPPASVPLLRVLGDAYARSNRLDQALETYRRALRRL